MNLTRQASSSTNMKIDLSGSAILIAITALVYFGVISPAIQTRNLARSQAAELTSEQSKSRDLERSVHATADKLNTSKIATASNSMALKPAIELNQRLAQLTELASDNGLQVDSIESGQTVDHDRYSTISIHLTGRGTFRACQTVLARLRSTMQDIGITSLQLTSGGVNTDTTATFTFDLLWHTQPTSRSRKK